MKDKNILSRMSQSVFGRAADTHSLEEENRRLQRAVEELSILNDLALAVGTSVDPQEMVHKLVDRLMRAVKAEQASVTLTERRVKDNAKTQVRVMASSVEMPRYHMNHGFLGWMELNKKPLVINDPKSDDRFKGVEWDPTIHSVMCVPLLVKSEMVGALSVYNKRGGGGFTQEDQRLLLIIAAQSAQIMDNARLISENAGMQEQVRLAYEIQRNLLPKEPPHIEGYDIAGRSIPAQTVGGDYYDFIRAASGDWAICLGDVSGKGLPASLLMANLQATLRGQTLLDAEVHERVGRANRLLCQSTDVEKFVTLFYGVLDVGAHELSFCNAGHDPPFLFSASNDVTRLEAGGVALGVIDDFPFEQKMHTMVPGDIVVIYSDGVPDAVNGSDEPFGVERLTSLVQEHSNEPAVILVEKVVEAVNHHAGNAPQLDDVTVVVIKRME